MGQPPLHSPTLADVSLRNWVILGTPHVAASQRRRLGELGLRAGSRVYLLLDAVGGGRVVVVDQGRVALDRATCRRIPVTVEATA
ncbi:MAG TPA: FeoA domain-containing protein [Acidothermaceae bacterium]|nr:FeoA domain-containing protein [Acidothermaceae bacterium]